MARTDRYRVSEEVSRLLTHADFVEARSHLTAYRSTLDEDRHRVYCEQMLNQVSICSIRGGCGVGAT